MSWGSCRIPGLGFCLDPAEFRQMTCHWRGGYLTREVFGELLEQISVAGRERGKSARVSVNWQQAVLRFDYVEAGSAPEASVVMEEANEGEKE